MHDPTTRRIEARATLYIEQTGDHLEVTRIVVDCPMPSAACIVASIPSPFDTDPQEGTTPWTEAEEAMAARILRAGFPRPIYDGGAGGGV